MKSPSPLIGNKDELWNNQFTQRWPIITLKCNFSSLLKVCVRTGVEMLFYNCLEMNSGWSCIIICLCTLETQHVVAIMYESMKLPQSKHSL
jgi:hypothetical protein